MVRDAPTVTIINEGRTTAGGNSGGGRRVRVGVLVFVGVKVGVAVFVAVAVAVWVNVAVGVLVFPHRPRHTYATRLLDAGCRVTSIQRFLGHKELSSTMLYARAHDQTVAEDYFNAMLRVEQRLEVVPVEEEDMGDVKVQEPARVFQLIERLEVPELRLEERLDITSQLRRALGVVHEHTPPDSDAFPSKIIVPISTTIVLSA